MRSGIVISAVFVLLWSTGFLGGKLGIPYAEPMTFLALRFGIVAILLSIWVAAVGGQWLRISEVRDQAMIGSLVHFAYLGGVFAGLSLGVEAGVAALIVGLQPIVTALAARQMLGERLVGAQWLGMALGFAGVGVVVARKLEAGLGEPLGVMFCFLSLIGIAFGSILQKTRSANVPMQSGNAVQFAAASLCCFAVALVFETMEIEWTGEFIFALGWLIVVLSLGAIAVLYWLIQRGAASEVASLFFLVPPVTAIFAWFLFGEVLGPLEIGGMVLTAVGVLLVNRPGIVARRVV